MPEAQASFTLTAGLFLHNALDTTSSVNIWSNLSLAKLTLHPAKLACTGRMLSSAPKLVAAKLGKHCKRLKRKIVDNSRTRSWNDHSGAPKDPQKAPSWGPQSCSLGECNRPSYMRVRQSTCQINKGIASTVGYNSFRRYTLNYRSSQHLDLDLRRASSSKEALQGLP